jgi:hypothetical protein
VHPHGPGRREISLGFPQNHSIAGPVWAGMTPRRHTVIVLAEMPSIATGGKLQGRSGRSSDRRSFPGGRWRMGEAADDGVGGALGRQAESRGGADADGRVVGIDGNRIRWT